MNRIVAGSIVAAGICGYGCLKWKSSHSKKLIAASETNSFPYQQPLPSRTEILKKLQCKEEVFDVLVIGGGATGCGVALDSVTRGLKTALVEKYDYSSGTSSRSTKLVHGGVRYLQKAIMKLDREQYQLVTEALHERANVLNSAPHLASPLPILLPVYKWWLLPYFWVGIKMYDLVAGKQLVKKSYFMGKEKTLEHFPMIKKENLCGSIVYYDGQQDDSRMNLTIALSAIRKGAACTNYVEVKNLLFEKIKNESKVCGVHVQDTITGEEWDIKAKCIVNATGPFTDSIRKLDNQDSPEICLPASGIHISLPDYYCPQKYGLVDPATSDGRVIFFLPWEGKTIVGTTDRKCNITYNPEPSEEEIQFVLKEIQKYLNPDIKVRRGDVLSAWSGIRPLVLDPSSKDTKSVSRNHVTDVSANKLVTIAGGKWTTYRSMAKDTVDVAVKALELQTENECHTDGLLLEGAEGWTPTYFIRLIQEFGMEPDVADHLARAYGVKAPQVVKLASMTGERYPVVGSRLSKDYPYIEAEVAYSVRNEYACSVVDVIARRLRIAFLDTRASDEMLPKIVQIMGDELKWDKKKRNSELDKAKAFLLTMGHHNPVEDVSMVTDIDINDAQKYTKIFEELDAKKSGNLRKSEVKDLFKAVEKRDPTENELDKIFNNGKEPTIDLNKFLQLMTSTKQGNVTNNPLGVLIHKQYLADYVILDKHEDE